MSKHTPGPWSVQVREYSFRVVDSRALLFDNSRLCDVVHWSSSNRGPNRQEAHANASLFAAAPDLLAALQAIMAGVAGCQREPHWEAARAAIAKATGGESCA